jgi:hypothetical protein
MEKAGPPPEQTEDFGGEENQYSVWLETLNDLDPEELNDVNSSKLFSPNI